MLETHIDWDEGLREKLMWAAASADGAPEPAGFDLLEFPRAERVRILIVDDEPANVAFLTRLLKRAGFSDLDSTTDSTCAASFIEESQPDLVLLDLHMPKTSGEEVLAEIRTLLSPHDYLPVLVLTGDSSPEARRRALALGAKDFLAKPFDVSEVLLRVRNLLHTRFLYRNMEAEVLQRTAALARAQQEILERLAAAAEQRDNDTGEHIQRVGRLAGRLARKMGIPAAEADLIERAAPLHDIGKISLPDTILRKPDALTPPERELMQTHTTIGAMILANGENELMRTAERIALCHHERWDGGGYPRGLRENQIPFEARIVCVADFFDALVHDRPYRPRWKVAKVLRTIEEGAGTHFDPDIARGFVAMMRVAEGAEA